MRFLLVHPPLLPPAVWRRVVPRLVDAGHVATAPDLAPGPRTRSWWRDVTARAVAADPRAEVVVAHSGAGPLVPGVSAALPRCRAVVLVDAGLPAASGQTSPDDAQRRRVASLAVDGVLPPWTSWWTEDVLRDLVPDDDDRQALRAGAPRLPAALWDVAVPVPAGWEPPVRGYLHLTSPYDGDAALARDRGWRTADEPGRHLDLLRRPHVVTRAVLDLVAGA